MQTIHKFDTTGEAYNAVQFDQEIKNGDFLFVPSEQVLGIAYTWPFALTKNHGALHTVEDSVEGRAILNEFRRSVVEGTMWAETIGYELLDMFYR